MAKGGTKIVVPTFTLGDLAPNERIAFERSFYEVRDQLAQAMHGGLVSIGLTLEIAAAHLRRTLNTHSVIDSLARLEGDIWRATSLKRPTRYKGDELNGLWHFHFWDARFIVKNLENEARAQAGQLSERLRPIFQEHTGELFEAAAGKIVQEAVLGSHMHRAKRRALTGECIVFEGAGARNYYLTMRLHQEHDSIVRQRIEAYRAHDAALGRLG